MRRLQYTQKMLSLMDSGAILAAVKEAKDAYNLSLYEAKKMIDSYNGSRYYDTMEGENDVEENSVSNIDERNVQNRVDSSIICPVCNKPVSSDASFCPNCGKSLKSSNVSSAKTKITICGITPPHITWYAGMFQTILEIDGIEYGTIPMKEKYNLYIDEDCELTFSINGTKPVSYNVKKGEEETIELVYDKSVGGLSIKGMRGNVAAKGCMTTMLLMMSGLGTMMSLLLFLFSNY